MQQPRVARAEMTIVATPRAGDFVLVRTRRWLVEDERSLGDGLTALRLACVDDDARERWLRFCGMRSSTIRS
jgi:hypothetical protein